MRHPANFTTTATSASKFCPRSVHNIHLSLTLASFLSPFWKLQTLPTVPWVIHTKLPWLSGRLPSGHILTPWDDSLGHCIVCYTSPSVLETLTSFSDIWMLLLLPKVTYRWINHKYANQFTSLASRNSKDFVSLCSGDFGVLGRKLQKQRIILLHIFAYFPMVPCGALPILLSFVYLSFRPYFPFRHFTPLTYIFITIHNSRHLPPCI